MAKILVRKGGETPSGPDKRRSPTWIFKTYIVFFTLLDPEKGFGLSVLNEVKLVK